MARTTTTVFTCDGCGAEVTRRDLRKFRLEEYTMGGTFIAAATTELCTGCEADKLHPVVKKIWPAEEFAEIEGIVRP